MAAGFAIKQKLRTKEISIFSNCSHFEWRAGLSHTILKGEKPYLFWGHYVKGQGHRYYK
jgi:hypothetical protein